MSGAGHSTQVAGPASRSVNMPGHALAGELSSSGEEKVFARAFWRPAGLCVFEERRVKAGGKSVCLWVGGFHVANFCKTRRRFEAYMYETRRRLEKVLSSFFFPRCSQVLCPQRVRPMIRHSKRRGRRFQKPFRVMAP